MKKHTIESLPIEQLYNLRDTLTGEDQIVKELVESLMENIVECDSNDYMMAEYSLISNFLWRAGRTEEGKYYIQQAKIFAEYATDKTALFEVYLQSGNYDYLEDDYTGAANWYFKAVELAESVGYDKDLGRAYNNIGSLLINNKDYEMGLHYYLMAEKLALKYNDQRVLPMLYSNISELYLLSGNFDKAEESISVAEPYVIKNGTAIRLLNHEINKWRYALHDNNYKQCVKSYEYTCALLERLPMGNDFIVAILAAFDNLVAMGESMTAVKMLEDTIEHLETLEDHQNLKKFYHHLIAFYDKSDYEERRRFYADKVIESDALLQEEKFIKRRTILNRLNYEYEERKKERKELKTVVNVLSTENSHLHAFNKNLKAIHDIGIALLSTREIDEIYRLLVNKVNMLFAVKDFAIAIVDDNERALVFKCDNPSEENGVETFEVPVKEETHLSVQCFLKNKEIVINDYQAFDAKRYFEFVESGINQSSLLYMPIAIDGRSIGVMTAQHPRKNAFSEVHLEIFRLLSTFAAVSIKNARHNKKLDYLARHDSLTNLYNRRTFEQVYKETVMENYRLNQALTLMLLDIDYFKQYNDTYGHVAGDRCIVEITTILKNTLCDEEVCIARYGGDEFIILLKCVDQPRKTAENLVEAVRNQNIAHESSLVSDRVTISIGVVNRKIVGNSGETLLLDADKALYKTKKELGRNGYCIFE